MFSVALKLTGGQEVLGLITHAGISFGLLNYEGKVPRKIFLLKDTPQSEVHKSHTLIVHKAISLVMAPEGIVFRPMYLSKPVLQGEHLGDNLMFHSNDVIGINLVIEQGLHLQYSKLVGTLRIDQLAPINHSSTPQ